jgi:EAL and modified HD-GYP domain-containing signal transduction protein
MSIFIARQPILDRHHELHAYELLFRTGRDNRFPDVDPDAATSRLISYVTTGFNLGRLTGAATAFVNLTRRVLVEDLYTVLPPDRVVIELLETVEPDAEVIEACHRLRDLGYTLALDDYVDADGFAPLIECASFLKVDFRETDVDERARLAQAYRSQLALLAEKVESEEEVEQATKLGYTYFQGFYFCQPKVVSTSEIPTSKLQYLAFFNEVFSSEIDYDRIETVIRQELSLTFKLMRLINSVAYRGQRTIDSIKEALVRLGENQLQKWATILTLSGLGDDAPRELISTSMVRGRLCELLADHVQAKADAHGLFLVGMLSLLDAILNRPMQDVIGELALSDEVREGIIDDESPLGRVRRLVVAHERGHWEAVAEHAAELGMDLDVLNDLYIEAIGWANEISGR